MKKWIIVAASLVVVFFISSYLFIPAKIIVARAITVHANPTAVYRFLNDESNWLKWWPGSVSGAHSNPVFEKGGYQFKKTRMLYESFEVQIEKDEDIENGLLYIFSLGIDSLKIIWSTTIPSGKNPLGKIRQYLKAREISSQVETILAAVQKHISTVQHVYGVDIRKEKVKVEFMVSAVKSFNHYPNTENIYEMIGQIKNYISREHAKIEDYPIMHISTLDSVNFDVQVAIPVDRNLPGTGILSSKKMLKGGDILVAEKTGGNNVADSVLKKMDQYVTDHKYLRIAIPFQSLVTDRLSEPDSNKWVTKIYYPIL